MEKSVCDVDKRLGAVYKKLIVLMSSKQSVTFRKLAKNVSEQRKFSRFMCNSRLGVSHLQTELHNSFVSSCPSSGHVLLIEDSTQMAYSLSRSISGAGAVDKGQVQGFYAHPVLVLDASHGGCYGISDVKLFDRDKELLAKTQQQTRSERNAARNKEVFEEKESYRWLEAIKDSVSRMPACLRKTVVADREGDIYALLVGLADLGVDYIIRAQHDRWVTHEGTKQKLSTAMEGLPSVMREVKLPATAKRTAHTAKLQLRYTQVVLHKGDSGKSKAILPATHPVWVVQVTECPSTVVNNEEPITWTLYTTHPLTCAEEAWQIIDWYKERWNVEQIFRTVKSRGLEILRSLLDTSEKLQKLALMALQAVVKVLQLVRAREGQTPQLVQEIFQPKEIEYLEELVPTLEGKTDKLKNPYAKTSLAYAAWAIARLAGWSGYQKDQKQGPIDFLYGLRVFNQQLQGYLIAQKKQAYKKE